MLTLFFASATFLQSWRIKNVCSKIAEQIAMQSSIAFYVLPAGTTTDGFDASLATSELCINRKMARVSEILWLHSNTRGCSLSPSQTVHIGPWISFPATTPSWLPFAYEAKDAATGKRNTQGKAAFTKGTTTNVYLLVETDIQPCYKNGRAEHVVHIEDYGRLIAWKIDSNLALLLETDIEHFTKLLYSTFLRNHYLINDQLPLLRIESITYEGLPQPFETVALHMRKSTRNCQKLSDEEWQKHVQDLRALSILANQATEFAYNKNRTEGKTGVVKPDLIPTEKKKAEIEAKKNEQASTSTKSASKYPAGDSTTDPAKTKLKAKPTEIKKPISSNTVLKGGNVTEQPKATTTGAIRKASPGRSVTKSKELEKIAVASVKASHIQKSPLHTQVTTTKPTAETSDATDSGKSYKTITTTAKTSTISSNKDQQATSTIATKAQDSPISSAAAATTNSENSKPRPVLTRNKDSLSECKPLNILVYSDSHSARDSAVATLKRIVEADMYTVYALTPQQAEQKHWLDNTALLVVCGAVTSHLGQIFVDYFLRGGKVLSICSDILYNILPTYQTAEVREHELVQFSYNKWQKVKMMHHIFCYQPSPVKKNFSTESDESVSQSNVNRQPGALLCPRSIELKDLQGEAHNLKVEVLGTEETWQTPSLLLAHSLKSDGKAVFSQIHLEIDPSQFETDESKYAILKENENIRLDIFADLLMSHLNISIKHANELENEQTSDPKGRIIFPNAYFLGLHESKRQLLEKLKASNDSNNIINTTNLSMKFCDKAEPQTPSTWSAENTNLLPILKHSCPEDFSTVDYFNSLNTSYVGRLVIYAPLISSSMDVLNDLELTNGIAVLPRQQVSGRGRSNNQWLSPAGCAMFSLQLHVSLDSPMGSRLPLMQHLIGLAMVNALKSHENYQYLDIGVKWPNDIYAKRINKIGGLVVQTTIMGRNAVVNIGAGINLNNSKPTTCINDLIRDYNYANKKHLPLLQYEECLAQTFNEIEKLLEHIQTTGDFTDFYKRYYELWLHSDQTISIIDQNGKQQNDAKVMGIDDYGYLQVRLSNGATETVQPDGNSFDMLKGLIVPKFN